MSALSKQANICVFATLVTVTADVVAEQSVGEKDDEIYDQLLGLRLNDDWFTQSTSDQPGCLLSSCIHTHVHAYTHTQAQTDMYT